MPKLTYFGQGVIVEGEHNIITPSVNQAVKTGKLPRDIWETYVLPYIFLELEDCLKLEKVNRYLYVKMQP